MIDIEALLDLSTYETAIRVARRKNSEDNTNEFFTPYSIVKKMCDKIPDSDWANPEKTFLEPSFGNGQFLLYIIYNRINHNIDWKTALNTLYGVELMQDNVDEAKERILNLLDKMEISYDKEETISIMNHNLVCSDFFKWDFENWRPISEPSSVSLF